MQRNYEFQDKGWISRIALGVQSMEIWLVEIQLMFKMTPEPKGWILGFDWGMGAPSTYWINGLKIIKTRDVNKITRLMGLTIMQASKNFKSNKLLRIFGRTNSISKTIVKHMNNWGVSGYSISARIICRGIQVTKNSKAVSSKDYRNNDEYFGVSCNNNINWVLR